MFDITIKINSNWLNEDDVFFDDLHIAEKSNVNHMSIRITDNTGGHQRINLFNIENPDVLFTNYSFIKQYCFWRSHAKERSLEIFKEFEKRLSNETKLILEVN